MKCFLVISVLVCILAVACASSYNSYATKGGRRSPANSRRSSIRTAAPASYNSNSASEGAEEPKAEPYKFNYQVDDGESKQERQENINFKNFFSRVKFSLIDAL